MYIYIYIYTHINGIPEIDTLGRQPVIVPPHSPPPYQYNPRPPFRRFPPPRPSYAISNENDPRETNRRYPQPKRLRFSEYVSQNYPDGRGAMGPLNRHHGDRRTPDNRGYERRAQGNLATPQNDRRGPHANDERGVKRQFVGEGNPTPTERTTLRDVPTATTPQSPRSSNFQPKPTPNTN